MQKRNLKEQLQLLLENHHLLSVEQMLVELAITHRDFNKTSVYRALDQLEAAGVVCKHNFTGSQALYELSHHHHAHLLCKICGAVSEAECEVSDPSELAGFKIDHHHLTFLGICAGCQLN